MGNGSVQTSPAAASRNGAGAAVESVPFVDLRAQHEEIRGAIEEAIGRIIDRSSFIGGEYVERFERDFAAYIGTAHAVGLGSGTDAVRIGLQVVGVRPGDAVATVAHTFIATAEAVTQIGAHPIFVDVSRDCQTMSPAALAALLDGECDRGPDGRPVHRATGRRIAAIVPVHLYGQSADMGPILELAEAYGVPVVEDACQAQGATCRLGDGREVRCGAIGHVAAFSFYPGKNLGAMGEAGALTTDDAELAGRARMLRDHGQSEKYIHATAEGSNARLDAIQAAVLGLKLARLDDWNEARREAARRYDAWFETASFEPVREVGRGRHVYHLYVVRVAERERIRLALAEAGVQTGLHYPIPLHLQEAYAELGLGPGSLPETEAAAASVLSLPMHPHLSEAQVDHVAEQLLRIAGAGA